MIAKNINLYRHELILPILLCSFILMLQPVKAELVILDEFNDIGWSNRILPDNDPDKFWIVSRLEGLFLLVEDQPGLWTIQLASNQHLLDAAGPTSSGLIYCTAITDGPQYERYISVFDCTLNQFTDTIELPTNYPINAIAMSDDEQKLYITVYTTNETAGFSDIVPENDGLVLELDIATETVTRTVPIQPRAETIFVFEDEAVLVSCDYWQWSWDPTDIHGDEQKSITQLIDIGSFSRIAEIPSGGGSFFFTNEFIKWDETHAAQFNNWLYGDFEDVNFSEGIWLLNPSTGSVVSTIGVKDDLGLDRGIRYACISNIREDILYVSTGQNITEVILEFPLIVTDLNGNYLDKAILPANYHPGFIFETEGGQLLVTGVTFGEEVDTTDLYILEWVNHPPVADLQVVTTMPYLGPSPAAIDFDASCSSDPDPGDILTYEWDFDGDLIFSEPVDDAFTGDPETPTHDYTSTYHGVVFVKVTDLEGAESICTAQVDVEII